MSIIEFLKYPLLGLLQVQDLLLILTTLFIARFLVIRAIKMVRYYCEQYKLSVEISKVIRQFVRILINFLSFLIILTILELSITRFLNLTLLEMENISLRVSNFINAIFILLAARANIWILDQLLLRYYQKRPDIDVGTKFAIKQMLKYIIYTIAILSSIQALGFNLIVVWGGAAALLVGFGLGLQQTFTDLISGIFMLIERGVNVGHIVQVGDEVGRVKKIGFRASEIITRDNIVLLIPNSQLVTDTVVNWSHNDTDVRFRVEVGVAYGTDTEIVKEILYKEAIDHNLVLQEPLPVVRFVAFGDSSLNFELLFWVSADHFIIIEDIKSDLYYRIDKRFRERKITIPFPQRDIWIKTRGDIKS